MAAQDRDRYIDLRIFRDNDDSGNSRHHRLRFVEHCVGNVSLSSSVGMQTADEKDKEANDVLGGAFKARRIGKLKERVIQASGGDFSGFADSSAVISAFSSTFSSTFLRKKLRKKLGFLDSQLFPQHFREKTCGKCWGGLFSSFSGVSGSRSSESVLKIGIAEVCDLFD